MLASVLSLLSYGPRASLCLDALALLCQVSEPLLHLVVHLPLRLDQKLSHLPLRYMGQRNVMWILKGILERQKLFTGLNVGISNKTQKCTLRVCRWGPQGVHYTDIHLST